MSDENKVILPKDVQLVINPNPTYLVTDRNGHTYVIYSEQNAREAMATHVLCYACRKPIPKDGGLYCAECYKKKSLDEAEEFNGVYPVFIGETFLDTEADLLDHIKRNKLDLSELLLNAAWPNRPASVGIDSIEGLFADFLFEDTTLPEPVAEACADFLEALKKIKDPISWTAFETYRLTEEQIADYTAKLAAME